VCVNSNKCYGIREDVRNLMRVKDQKSKKIKGEEKDEEDL